MKNLIFLFVAATIVGIASAQEPVRWAYKAKKMNRNVFEVHFTATIALPWHIYSLNTPKGGPAPTKIIINKNPITTSVGTINEKGKLISKYEDAFGVDVRFFEQSVDFVQRVELKGNFKTNLTGTISYMACNDEKCLPLKTEKFNIPIQ